MNPWEKYQKAETMPWEKYTQAEVLAPSPSAPPVQTGAPLWDVPGDINRAFTGSIDAMKADAQNAFTSGHTGPTGEGGMGVLKRTGQDILALPGKFVSGLKVPLDVASAAVSPITGTLNATIGSALSYLPGMDKQKADEAIGLALAGARPAAPTVPKVAAPTIEELKTASDAAYKAGRASGLEIEPKSTQVLASTIKQNLEAEGFRAANQPKTFKAIDEISTTVGPTANISDIEGARRVLNKARMDSAESASARIAINQIDSYLENIPKQDVVAGDPAVTSGLFKEARANWAAAKRAERIDEALQVAQNNAGSTYSGMNLNNATRQQLKNVLNGIDRNKIPGFTEEEISQLRRAVKGTATGNTMRYAGNLMGGGGGLGMLASGGAGYATLGPIGAIGGPIVGLLARVGATKSTLRQAAILDEMLRARSPLARSRVLPPVTPNYVPAGLLYSGLSPSIAGQ